MATLLRNSQILWIGVLDGVRFGVRLVGSFDLFAVGEGDAGADEGDQVGCVDLALTPDGGHLVREDLHHGKTASGVHS